MTTDKRGFFSKIFLAMMIFCGLTWAWTAAIIIGWPKEKTSVWQPQFRLVATCADKEACGVAYKDIEADKASGRIISLLPPEPAGDVEEEMNWLNWKTQDGVLQVKSSSWHFQTVLHYRMENDTPVLIDYQDVSGKAFFYGVGAALFTLIGLYLRKLRG